MLIKPLRRATLLLSLAQALSFTTATAAEPAEDPAIHPATVLHLPDPGSAKVRATVPADTGQRRTSLSKGWSATRSDTARDLAARTSAQLVGTVQIKPWLLAMPTEREVDLSQPATATAVPRQFAALSLQIGDEDLALWVVGVTQDGSLRHVSAAITNAPDASALFTVTSDDDRVFGTITTRNRSYRILPISKTEQAVYELMRRAGGPAAKDTAVSIARMTAQEQAVQRRHLQAQKVAELQFEFVDFRLDGNTFASRGGRFGRFTPKTAAVDDIAKLLAKAGALTNADKLGQFRIVERNEHSVRFEQLINGIAVAARNEITTTPAGDVDEVRLFLTDPARAPAGQPMSQAEAMSRAAKAYAAGAEEEVEFTGEPRLFYRRTAASEPLELLYEFSVRRPNAPHAIVRINALTGAVTIRDASLGVVDEFGFDIYIAESGAPKTGSDPGTRLIVSEGGQSPCTVENPAPCITAESIVLTQIFVDVRRAWKAATDATDPTLCCDRLGTKGSDNVQFIYDTSGATSVAEYNEAYETILFKTPPANGTSAARNTDAVVHEMTHHFLHKVGGLDLSDDFARMLHEGMADAMVGAIAELRDPYTEWVGDPNAWFDLIWQGQKWVIGDGTSPLSQTRDASVNRQWSYISSVLGNVANPDRFHQASLAISNFFYRLYSTHNATDARFIELILKTAQWLNDWNENGALDLNDFYYSLTHALRPNETALLNSINQIWAQMGASVPPPSGGPNPPGPTVPPVAPAVVDGFPLACDQGLAIHRASWSPTANTSTYRTYVGPFENIFDSSVTQVYAWSNFSTDFRVRSCNIAGCSSQSVDSYFMNYNAVCGF
jgi:hypothetical protein